MAETPFGRNVNSHVLRRHSFGKENTRRVSESPPTPVPLTFSKIQVALRLTSYRKSYQVALVAQTAIARRTSFRHLAGYTRTWPQSGYGLKVKSNTNSTRREFSTNSKKQSQERPWRRYLLTWPRTCLAGLQGAVPAQVWFVLKSGRCTLELVLMPTELSQKPDYQAVH